MDRNIAPVIGGREAYQTFPARGTWIEIRPRANTVRGLFDVPRKGNVDRNLATSASDTLYPVDVPRKGNVDRNFDSIFNFLIDFNDVPRKGNVDRNPSRYSSPLRATRDVPRKGTVDRNETIRTDSDREVEDVPRKGNVDRNTGRDLPYLERVATFPARGTWIEIRSKRIISPSS